MTTRTKRLMTEPNIWLAAVRADGRPHLTPIWFVWVDEKIWLCTQRSAVKARILSVRPLVSFALEDGNAPVTGEGVAALVSVGDAPPAVSAAFRTKYDWNLGDSDDNVIIEITVSKWLFPGADVVTD
jgi:F420H(2)-dependent biliverdin reductase